MNSPVPRREPPARSARPSERPRAREADPIVSDAPAGFAGISWTLWALLLVAVLFLAVVRWHVNREEERWGAALAPAAPATPALTTSTPTAPVRAEHLKLYWDAVDGAHAYRLHIQTVTGRIVVEGLTVEYTEWFPPFDALPGFEPGEYRWSVDALDAEGAVISRSEKSSFRVL